MLSYTGTACVVVLLAAAAPAALADSTRYMNGCLERVVSNDNYTTCAFTVGGKNSPAEVHDRQMCSFLLRAYQHDTPVSVQVNIITHTFGADEYNFGVSFHNRNALWAGQKLETESFNYQLVGSVQDVYYINNHCYIAVDTGYDDVRNNKVYHNTADLYICNKAISAFYLGERVVLIASVDVTPKYSNDIIRLLTAKCG